MVPADEAVRHFAHDERCPAGASTTYAFLMSDAAQPLGTVAHGTDLLPADLTEEQLDAAPVLASVESLLIENLTDSEVDDFAAALEA